MEYVIALLPMSFFIIFLVWMGACLYRDQNWKLSEALSEQIEEKKLLRDAQGNPMLKQGTGEPVYESIFKYSNSSSRLIAIIGLFAIVTWVMAIVMPATLRFARSGEAPDLGNFSTFILAQAGIFTPYIVNKITYIFTRPGKT
jgi:hypothetical protein